MRKNIKTLQDALTYQLQNLFYAETKIQKEFSICSQHLTAVDLKKIIKNYIDSADDKLLKIERIFNYLMKEKLFRKNAVINALIDETHLMLTSTSSAHLKHIVMIACIQTINAYKIATYKTVYMFTLELGLDAATDLLQQILEWELETQKTLAIYSIKEFNKAQHVVTSS